MPSSTSRLALPYPLASDPDNVPSDVQALAARLDTVTPAGPGYIGAAHPATMRDSLASGAADITFFTRVRVPEPITLSPTTIIRLLDSGAGGGAAAVVPQVWADNPGSGLALPGARLCTCTPLAATSAGDNDFNPVAGTNVPLAAGTWIWLALSVQGSSGGSRNIIGITPAISTISMCRKSSAYNASAANPTTSSGTLVPALSIPYA